MYFRDYAIISVRRFFQAQFLEKKRTKPWTWRHCIILIFLPLCIKIFEKDSVNFFKLSQTFELIKTSSEQHGNITGESIADAEIVTGVSMSFGGMLLSRFSNNMHMCLCVINPWNILRYDQTGETLSNMLLLCSFSILSLLPFLSSPSLSTIPSFSFDQLSVLLW